MGVGLAHEHAANDTEVLPLGAVLVAYSDGLVERRRADIDEQLAALQQIVIEEVLGLYLLDADERLASLRSATDPETTAAAAHALKGGSGDVGATRVQALAAELAGVSGLCLR